MENDLFKEFQQVSASGDAKATMLALLHWLDYSNLPGTPAGFQRLSNWQLIPN